MASTRSRESRAIRRAHTPGPPASPDGHSLLVIILDQGDISDVIAIPSGREATFYSWSFFVVASYTTCHAQKSD